MVHTYHGILLSNKKYWAIDICDNLEESPENYSELKKKKANPKMLDAVWSIYVTFIRGKILQMEKRLVIPGL